MNSCRRFTRALPLFAVAIALGIAEPGLGEIADLQYKTYRDWDFVLPKESVQRVSGDFEFLEGSPSKFRTVVDGAGLRIDRDADGETDAKVEGEAGVVTLRGKTGDGGKFTYSIRLLKTNAGWVYASSGAALATIDDQKIRFIDQNNNGRYDEYGVDAMVVGPGKYASFLSRVINIRGKLYAIDISRDGRKLSFEPYAGEWGTLDLTTKFATKGKLLSAVISSHDSEISFSLSSQPMAVPAGKYHLYQGLVGLGRNVVTFSNGEVSPMDVAADETLTVPFGEPVTIEFQYIRQPGRVIMTPDLVRYVGRAGEVYAPWTPFGGSPQFEVRNGKTGEQISLAIFGGT